MVPYNEDSQLVIKGMEVRAPFFYFGDGSTSSM